MMAAAEPKAKPRDGIERRTDKQGNTSYRWRINSKSTGLLRGKWTTSYAEAKNERAKKVAELASGTVIKSDGTTLRDAMEEFLTGIENGSIDDRKGKTYKPSTVRSYKRAWKLRLEPELGAHRLADIKRADVQDLVDRLRASGLAPSTIRNTLDPLRRVFDRAIKRDKVAINPCTNLEVPTSNNGRERFATKEEAAALIAAVAEEDRALWATAFYTGMRSGELQAVRWSDVDFDKAIINVQRGWDDDEDEIDPKTKNAKRKVPLIPRLVRLLKAHQQRTGRKGEDLIFGRTANETFYRATIRWRALTAWGWKEVPNPALRDDPDATPKMVWVENQEAETVMEPIGLHEARHTAASLMIAAGANAKALSTVMGHASITITFDRYGHLMPGGESEVGRLLSVYINGEHDDAE